MFQKLIITVSLLFMASAGFSWESYDQVVAIVNNTAIVESEIEARFEQLKKTKRVHPSRYAYEKSRTLDELIEEALVSETAENEAIIISDSRVATYLGNYMGQYYQEKGRDPKGVEGLIKKLTSRLEKRLKSEEIKEDSELDPELNRFIKYVEAKYKTTFAEFFEQVRTQIRREQVMSIAIGISPPSKEEAMAWYRQNRQKLGYEVRCKQILVKPRSNSLKDQMKANEYLESLRNRIMRGESFERLAARYSQDPETRSKGGDMGWKMLGELDPYFAGNVNRLTKRGQMSPVFKSGEGYHLVKYLGKRPVSFESVEKFIMYKLYSEKMGEQFEKWIKMRKRESEINILMKNYVKS